MHWSKIFLLVSLGALAGMAMGGAFGFGAGTLAPTFFAHLKQWRGLPDIEPRGIAVVFGGIAGVLLGGTLSAFSIVVYLLSRAAAREKSAEA